MTNKNLPSSAREDVAEMERFRKIIEGGFSKDPWDRVGGKPDPSVTAPDRPVSTANGEDKDMVKFVALMENMYGDPEKAAEKLVEASANNPEMAEALDTTTNKDGVKIGKWQIRVRTDESSGKKKKYFDVAHSVSKQVIAKNLYVYEAALALVRYLNKGKPINGPEIQKVLKTEQSYYSHRVDALTHQVNSLKALKRNDHEKSAILETRYQEAKAKALKLEEQLRSIAKSAL